MIKPMKYDLEERTAAFAEKIIELCKKVPKNTVNIPVVDQLVRAGTSVGANYVESQAGSSRKDFANFLYISLKSANESKYWLAILRDTKKGETQIIGKLLGELEEISRILAASIITTKSKD